jgi:hypothetical protein
MTASLILSCCNRMKYLTFLDYPTVEATGRSFEAQLKQKDREIEELKRHVRELESAIDPNEIRKFKAKLEELKNWLILIITSRSSCSSSRISYKNGLIWAILFFEHYLRTNIINSSLQYHR